MVARALRERGVLRPLREDLASTRPEPPQPDTSAPVAPAAATITRRGWLGLVGAASAGLVVVGGGASWGGLWRSLSPLSPRGLTPPGGPGGFPVNKTAVAAGIDSGHDRLGLAAGGRGRAATGAEPRAQLLALAQSTQRLPIACVEGWSTFQTWTGVPLRELARLAGVERLGSAFVRSLQREGSFTSVTLNAGQVDDPRSLLALRVNGADLSLDHGYPARLIVPALPGRAQHQVGRRAALRRRRARDAAAPPVRRRAAPPAGGLPHARRRRLRAGRGSSTRTAPCGS